jgi:addiction module RelE/StbE family toxin
VTYRLKYTQTFEKRIEKIKKKDKTLMEEATKKVEKLQEMPYTGKPLEYRLAPYRSVRVRGKYRLVYRVNEEEKEVVLVAFGHRKEIYKFVMFLREE